MEVLLVFLMLGAEPKLCFGLSPGIRWWEPYTPSEGTLGLWHFDGKDRELSMDAAAHTVSVEIVGDVGGTTEGRFGAGLAINGRPGAMKVLLKDPLPGTSRLSAEAWVYLDRYPETEGCLLFHPRVLGQQNEWSLLIDHQGRVVMRWLRHNVAANAESLTVATPPNAAPVGTWTHIAGVFRWDTKASIYINGVEKGFRLFQNLWGVQDGLPAETSAGPTWIGNNDALTKPWPGKIDELRISSDLLQLSPRSDNAWTDPEAHRPLKRGRPFTPDDAKVLLHASFDNGTDADLARGDPKASPLPTWYALPASSLQPGVRGQSVRCGVSFQQKGNINLKEGTLEFWFQPLNWTNIHSYHVGVFNGPFMIYILNTGVVWPGGVPLVTWFNDKTYLRFGGVFAPEEWRHVVMSWKGQEVRAYLDGERVNTGGPSAGTLEQVAAPWPMMLGGNNAYDELYIYNRMLSDKEVANCYWRYRDPAKVKPIPEIEWHATYLAGVECVKATADATHRPQVRKLRHEVLDKNGRLVWRGQPQPVPSAGQEIVEKLPRLADGVFTLRADFLDAKGTPISRASRSFTVKHFSWEHNDIGKKPIIIPPYTPITVDGRHLEPWGRDIQLSDTGLPEQIEAMGKPLLAAPIRLEGKQGEAEFIFTGSKVDVKDVPGFKVLNADDYTQGPLTGAIPPMKLARSSGYQALTVSEGHLGALKAKVNGTLDIDGWYQVKVTLIPDKPTTLDQLDLVCDLAPEADTLYAQTSDTSQDPNGYVNSSGEFGEIKQEVGEVWNSKVLRTSARWKTFVPQVFVGTGERGLWWLAESDEGWVLSDDQPCVRIERLNDRVRLRIRIIGATTIIAAPRTFEFALLPEPVKPRPHRWRELAWCRGDANKNYYTHDTCGYRYYGDSVDSYALHTEKDFADFNAFLHNFAQQTPYYNWYEGHYGKGLREGVPHSLYGSTSMTGLGMDEFKYYGPEWLGSENWKPVPDLSFEGVPSYGNSYRWTTPEQLSAVGVNFDHAHADCFIWYHKRLLERCPVNGTWWDNTSIGTITEYVPGRGKVEKWNTFLRRDLTRRLAVMGYEIGRRPWWLQNMHADFSWCQVGWHIENDFYIQGQSKDLIDQLGIHKFRALTRAKGGLLNQLHCNCPIASFSEEENRHAERTIIGLCLLHDIGERGLPRWRKQEADLLNGFLDPLEKSVGFMTGDPEFIPYWRQEVVKIDEPGVYASVFAGKGSAAIVMVNANQKDVILKDFTVKVEKLGLKSIDGFCDVETSVALQHPTTGWTDPGCDGVRVEAHGLRLLLLKGIPGDSRP